MISEKMIAMAKGGSAIRAMFEEGNRMAALYGRENVYDYSLGNPNFPAPKALNDAIHHIIDTESDTCYYICIEKAVYVGRPDYIIVDITYNWTASQA